MARILHPVVHDILNSLLDQFEQPNRQRVSRVRLEEHAGYTVARSEVNTALTQLADQDMVRLRWRKWEEHNWLDVVDLTPERAGDIYTLLGRVTRTDRVARLRQFLVAQTPQADWYAAFIRQMLAQLDAARSVAPLDLDDPIASAELLMALDAAARLNTPVLERVFSVQIFRDSKRFETLRSRVITVLRRHAPDAGQFGDDDDALLREHYLERAPEYILVGGPLVLKNGESEIDLTSFAPSAGLSASMLRRATVHACTATVLMTVENLTSFSELATRRPADWLLVYTGGFASPTVIAFLRQVREVAQDIPIRHWGDIDAGGLRILAHLRLHLGAVSTVAMDRATLQAYAAFTQPLTTGDRRALGQLRQSPVLADCMDVIDALLSQGTKLEQEAIRLEDVTGMEKTKREEAKNAKTA